MKIFKLFIPSIIFFLVGIILFIIRANTAGLTERFVSNMIYCLLTMLAFPLINIIFKLNLPQILNIALVIQAFLALCLGSAYNFYKLYPFYDKIVHGLFGVDAFLYGYFIIVRTNAYNINTFGLLLLMLFIAMGMAALWECLEYMIDLTTGSDTQHVYDYLEGKTPIYDTMTDMLSTFIMTLIIDILYLLDTIFLNGKVMNYLLNEFLTDKQKAEMNIINNIDDLKKPDLI